MFSNLICKLKIIYLKEVFFGFDLDRIEDNEIMRARHYSTRESKFSN